MAGVLRPGRGPTEDKAVFPRGLEGGILLSPFYRWGNRPGAGHLGEAEHVFQGSGFPAFLGFEPEAIPATGDRLQGWRC